MHPYATEIAREHAAGLQEPREDADADAFEAYCDRILDALPANLAEAIQDLICIDDAAILAALRADMEAEKGQ